MYILLAEEEREYDILLSASMFSKAGLSLNIKTGNYTIIGQPFMDTSYIRSSKSVVCNVIE